MFAGFFSQLVRRVIEQYLLVVSGWEGLTLSRLSITAILAKHMHLFLEFWTYYLMQLNLSQ